MFALGFVGVIAIATVLESAFGLRLGRGGIKVAVLALGFGPAAARRLIFGAPKLPPPRTGALWSLVSIVGLLCLIAGVGGFAIGAVTISGAFEQAPDFVAQARTSFGASELSYAHVIDPTETPAAEAARRERVAANNAREIADAASDARRQWEARQSSNRRTSLVLASLGLLATLAGAFLTWLRYPRADAAPPPS